MQSNSYVFGASMSPRGFAVRMSPALVTLEVVWWRFSSHRG